MSPVVKKFKKEYAKELFAIAKGDLASDSFRRYEEGTEIVELKDILAIIKMSEDCVSWCSVIIGEGRV